MIDFGLALRVDRHTKLRNAAGTLLFMPPELCKFILAQFSEKYAEQVKHRTLDAEVLKKGDLWAIGSFFICICFFFLHPFFCSTSNLEFSQPFLFFVVSFGLFSHPFFFFNIPGVITHILLTGRVPFSRGPNVAMTCANIVEDQLEFGREEHYLSESACDFITKLLAKDPVQRPTIDQALQHPWVTGESAKSDAINQVLANVHAFEQDNELRTVLAKFVLKSLNDNEMKRMEESFRQMDENGDGVLQEPELVKMLVHTGFTQNEAEVEAKRMMTSIDKNGDGSLLFIFFCIILIQIRLSQF
jgi:serine/threonine protein kinase